MGDDASYQNSFSIFIDDYMMIEPICSNLCNMMQHLLDLVRAARSHKILLNSMEMWKDESMRQGSSLYWRASCYSNPLKSIDIPSLKLTNRT